MQPRSDVSMDAEAPLKGTGSLQKALRLLSNMSDAEASGLRLNEVVSRTGLDPATAHRMLACLVAEGFMEKLPEKRYRLGPRMYELGLAAAPMHTPARPSHRHLDELAKGMRVTAVLSRRSGAESVYVDRVEGCEAVPGLRSALGTRLPLGIGAGGVAILASMPTISASALIDGNTALYRRYDRAAPRLLQQRIAAAKSAGFAVTDSFLRPGIRAVGIVVPTEHRGPELAVSVVLGEAQPFDADELLPALRRAARGISRAIQPYP